MNDPLQHIISRSDTWRGFEATHSSAFALLPANSDWHGVDAMPTGFKSLDQAIKLGGWPQRGSVEVLTDSCGMGAMGLFLPTMEKLSAQGRWQAFIAPPYTPYAPLLAARGIDTQQILMVHPKSREDLLWATEQALRSSTCSVVFSWLGASDYRYSELRKLQLAAAENDTLAVFFRATSVADQHTPASLRLKMSGYRSVDILKQRAGKQALGINLPSDDDIPTQPQLWEIPEPMHYGNNATALSPVSFM